MAVASVLKLVRIVQRIGKKINNPIAQAMAVLMAFFCVVTARAMILSPHASRFLPTMRIRKIATMLARMIA